MVSDGIVISLIGLAGAILAPYIALRYRKKKPSEYVDTAFDALISVIKVKDQELQVKDQLLDKKDTDLETQKSENAILRAEIERITRPRRMK